MTQRTIKAKGAKSGETPRQALFSGKTGLILVRKLVSYECLNRIGVRLQSVDRRRCIAPVCKIDPLAIGSRFGQRESANASGRALDRVRNFLP